MLNAYWKSSSGDATSLAIAPGATFARGGPGKPDIFLESRQGRITLVLANGDATTHTGTMTGTFAASYGGAPLFAKTNCTLYDGCARVFRKGEPAAYDPPEPWEQFWLRHWQETSAWEGLVKDLAHDFDDAPYFNPDQSGSARVCQSAWSGTLSVVAGTDSAHEAAIAFTGFQLQYRHEFYYLPDGSPLRAAAAPWWRQGVHGWVGQVIRPSASPYQRETLQHKAPDRFFTLAAGYGDFPATLLCDAYIEGTLTEPECRSSQLADDMRSHGYLLRTLALDMLRRPNYQPTKDGLVAAVAGLRKAMSVLDAEVLYPCRNPPKTGKWPYGWPSLLDWTPYAAKHALALPPEVPPPTHGGTCDHMRPWLAATAKARNLPGNYYTDADTGLWGLFRGVALFQCGVLLQGLCVVRDIPPAAALVPDIDKLIQHVTACILGPGTAPGRDPSGVPVLAQPLHYAYASGWPGRVMPWGFAKNGTVTWLCNPLLMARASLKPNQLEPAQELARGIWEHTDYPQPRDIEVFGLLAHKEFA